MITSPSMQARAARPGSLEWLELRIEEELTKQVYHA